MMPIWGACALGGSVCLLGFLGGWLVGIGRTSRKQGESYSEGFAKGKQAGLEVASKQFDLHYQNGVEFGRSHPRRDDKGHFLKTH